jgi:hypothetical protein
MISNLTEYEKAQEELRSLEERLARLQQSHPSVPRDSPRPAFAK